MIGKLLHWLYCLDFGEALLIVAVGTVAYGLIDRWLYKHWWRRLLALCTLLALGAAIIYTTLGNRSGGGDFAHAFIPFHSYREVQNGGNIEIYRSNFMNVVFFYPAGLLATSLLSQKWSGRCRCLLVVLVLTAMSIGIEFLQYRFALGRCEIDDVIHNALGALLGSMATLLLPRCLDLLGGKIKSK